MPEAARLLELIEERITEHGGDLGGWTARSGGRLSLFDGRVTLRAEIVEARDGKPVHAHVFATVREYGGEVLEACVMGMGESRDEALAQAAMIWMQGVAAPVRSLLDGREVCMASRVELGGSPSYAGPFFPRGLDEPVVSALDDTLPWFRYAAESAPPKRLHLAKVTVSRAGGARWTRQLEMDGHAVSHCDADWPAGVTSDAAGYLTRFAVFEFTPEEVGRRAELDRAIRHFAGRFGGSGSVDALVDGMVRDGFDPHAVHDIETVSILAFGRSLFEDRGAIYPPTIIRARADGRVEADVPLLPIPAYGRARALFPELQQTLSRDDLASLCLYGPESGTILKAMEELGSDVDLASLVLYPCVFPDREATQETVDAAVHLLHQMIEGDRPRPPAKKPWWKVW